MEAVLMRHLFSNPLFSIAHLFPDHHNLAQVFSSRLFSLPVFCLRPWSLLPSPPTGQHATIWPLIDEPSSSLWHVHHEAIHDHPSNFSIPAFSQLSILFHFSPPFVTFFPQAIKKKKRAGMASNLRRQPSWTFPTIQATSHRNPNVSSFLDLILFKVILFLSMAESRSSSSWGQTWTQHHPNTNYLNLFQSQVITVTTPTSLLF